jgi:drug/metabolite transporter (DMT)-like permease
LSPPAPNAGLASGTALALAAGLLWGLVFIAPLLLPDYPALLLSAARYLAFGLIALPLAWWDRAALAQLSRADWLEALKLSLVGNLLYYAFLAAAIQRAGGPLPTVIIGTLPVVIALATNWRDRRRAAARIAAAAGPVSASPGTACDTASGTATGAAQSAAADASPSLDAPLPWRRLAPSLLLLGAGIALVNHTELARLRSSADADLARYAWGGLLAVGAVICWTWYPIRNADWLRAHPGRPARAWATAQGLATLPLAALAYALFWGWSALATPDWPMPLGPAPERYLALMFAIGLLGSWLGTLCWNAASQRLPTTLAGQLIVFETLAALSYAWVLRGHGPDAPALAGVALLVAGVVWALRR